MSDRTLGNRDELGRLLPGHTANPAGRPKDEIRSLAREYGEDALRRILDLMKDENKDISLRAAQAILDRGFGKPAVENAPAVESIVTRIVVTIQAILPPEHFQRVCEALSVPVQSAPQLSLPHRADATSAE